MIAHALELLRVNAPTAPIILVHTAPCSFCMSLATAWTDGVSVFVNDQSEPYRRGKKDARALAGALAHEAFHVAHGPAEAPAYVEQLRVLRLLRVRGSQLEDVERAARIVGALQ